MSDVRCSADDLIGRHQECERFKQVCQTVSTEAFALANPRQIITETGAKWQAALKDAFRFLTTWDYSRPETLNASALKGRLRRVPYTDLMELRVAKPVGFQGNLHQYVTTLHKQRLPVLLGIKKDVIEALAGRLAYYLNDPERLGEYRPQQGLKGYEQEVLTKLLNQEAGYLLQDNRGGEAPFADLYDNNTQCVDAMLVVNEINSLRWRSAQPKELASATQRLSQVAEALLATIQQQESLSLSKQVVGALADDLELAARWIEFASVLMTRIIDTTTALKATEKTLLRVL